MMSLDMHMTQRLWEWKCRTVDHIPLRLADLPLTHVPVERIPDGGKGLNLSRTQITAPGYPARLPLTLRSLQHNRFLGTTLWGLHLTDLENLVLEECPHLESIGPLPLTLKRLTIYRCPNFKSLPEFLPEGLEWLVVDGCPDFKVLPRLPNSLKELRVRDSGVTRLPNLPDDVENVYIPETSFESRMLDFQWTINRLGWPQPVPSVPQRAALLTSFVRTQERMKTLKEDLVAAMWHPRRVEAWLTAGEDVLDMMMGC